MGRSKSKSRKCFHYGKLGHLKKNYEVLKEEKAKDDSEDDQKCIVLMCKVF